MRFGRTIFGKWNSYHVMILKKHGIHVKEGYDMFGIDEDEDYMKIIHQLKSAQEFNNRRTVAKFSKEELLASPYYLCLSRGPELSFPVESGEDGKDYLRFAYGEICNTCLLPMGEQINPINLRSEKKLPKKYLFGSHHWLPRAIITDYERYQILENKYGFKSREIVIGKSKRISDKLVQVIIPESKDKLDFGNSYFGRTFKKDGTGQLSSELTLCPECKQPMFTNSILDYFPMFKDGKFEGEVVMTQEWFEYFHHLVISKEFTKFLINYKMVKMDSQYLIPVKDFSQNI